MSTIFEKDHMKFRQLRREFMVEAIRQGQGVLDKMAITAPDLSRMIQGAFPNRGRAAFWLMSDTDRHSYMTPLQQLARGQYDNVKNRLQQYVAHVGQAQPAV